MAMKKGGLGKGLSSIFFLFVSEDRNSTVTLKISEIEPNTKQPRRDFDPETLRELSESIEQHGGIQPLVVRPLLDGGCPVR